MTSDDVGNQTSAEADKPVIPKKPGVSDGDGKSDTKIADEVQKNKLKQVGLLDGVDLAVELEKLLVCQAEEKKREEEKLKDDAATTAVPGDDVATSQTEKVPEAKPKLFQPAAKSEEATTTTTSEGC